MTIYLETISRLLVSKVIWPHGARSYDELEIEFLVSRQSKTQIADEIISVIEIAKIHGKHRQTIHRILRRLGVETTKQKSSEARGQLATYISKDDYELIREELEKPESTNTESIENSGPGVFYLIQLAPQHDPGRIKVGFATSADDRLRKHKTAAPYSIVINTWPCKFLWEKTAIDSVTQGCERLHTEVFRTNDINQVIERCNKFFFINA